MNDDWMITHHKELVGRVTLLLNSSKALNGTPVVITITEDEYDRLAAAIRADVERRESLATPIVDS